MNGRTWKFDLAPAALKAGAFHCGGQRVRFVHRLRLTPDRFFRPDRRARCSHTLLGIANLAPVERDNGRGFLFDLRTNLYVASWRLPSGIHDPFMSEFLASVSGTQRPSHALQEYQTRRSCRCHARSGSRCENGGPRPCPCWARLACWRLQTAHPPTHSRKYRCQIAE
jgi:hypothetical protein